MTHIEQIELDAHREQLGADVRELVEKYRAIFEWDVPEIDEARSDRLILSAIRQALDSIDKALPGPRPPGMAWPPRRRRRWPAARAPQRGFTTALRWPSRRFPHEGLPRSPW
jgi:hypothetical protein